LVFVLDFCFAMALGGAVAPAPSCAASRTGGAPVSSPLDAVSEAASLLSSGRAQEAYDALVAAGEGDLALMASLCGE
jgi:hypothetical protein